MNEQQSYLEKMKERAYETHNLELEVYPWISFHSFIQHLRTHVVDQSLQYIPDCKQASKILRGEPFHLHFFTMRGYCKSCDLKKEKHMIQASQVKKKKGSKKGKK